MADRYWVGGTAFWDGSAGTKWSTTSGGSGGAAVPTSFDDVFFTDLSTGTCTIDAGTTGAKSINFTGFTGTLAGSNPISVSGSVTLVAGMTFNYTGTISILATGSIITAGKSLGGLTVNGVSITVTLTSNTTVTGTTTLTRGTLALAGFTLSTGILSSNNSNFRSITFGVGNIELTTTGIGATALDMADVSNFTYTGTGGFVRNQVSAAALSFGSLAGGSSSTAISLTVNAGGSSLTLIGTSHFKSINFTGYSGIVVGTAKIYGSFTGSGVNLYTGFSLILGATTTFNPTSSFANFGIDGAGITVTLGGDLTVSSLGTFTLTQGTINLNGFALSTGTFSSNNSNTRSIAFGSSIITLTSTTNGATVLDMGQVQNYTYTGTAEFVRDQSATATMVFGTSFGSETNAPKLIVNAGSAAITITNNSHFKSINFTGNSSAVTALVLFLYGDLTLSSGGTYTAVSPRFYATGTLTSNGKTLSAITVGTSLTSQVTTCADALTLTNGITFLSGTLKLQAGTTSTINSFSTFGTTLKYLESTTPGVQATISDASGTNTVTFLSIQDSNAIGGAIFRAIALTNVNAGNNTGWTFASGGGNMLLMF